MMVFEQKVVKYDPKIIPMYYLNLLLPLFLKKVHVSFVFYKGNTSLFLEFEVVLSLQIIFNKIWNLNLEIPSKIDYRLNMYNFHKKFSL